MKPTPFPVPHHVPAVIGIAVTLLGIVMLLPDHPALNFWGVVIAVFSPILYSLEYTPAVPADSATAMGEEVSRG